jgi:hypothetical protein
MSQSYQRLLYRVLHRSMDEFIVACSKCEAHRDILSLNDEPSPDDPQRLLEAQQHTNGSEDDVPHLSTLINVCTSLLVLHRSREEINPNPVIDPHDDPCGYPSLPGEGPESPGGEEAERSDS